MGFADTSGALFSVVPETTWGTLPATPAWEQLRFNSESLTNQIATQTSQEIRPDYGVADLVRVGAQVQGDANLHFIYGPTIRSLIAGALRGTWATPSTGALSQEWLAADKSVNRTDGGSYLLDGFKKGESVTVAGTTTNTGPFTVDSVAKDKMTFTESVTDEGPLSCTLTGAETTVLKRGILRPSWSAERKVTTSDGTDLYARYTGVRVGGMNSTFQTGQISGLVFNLMGRGEETATTPVAGASYVAPSTNDVQAAPDVAQVRIDGITEPRTYTQLTLQQTNNLRAQQGLGGLPLAGIGYGQCNITGQLVLFKEGLSVYDLFPAGTRTALHWQTADSQGNVLSFNVPLKFNTGQAPIPGLNQDVFDTMGYTGLIDPVAGTDLVIVDGAQA